MNLTQRKKKQIENLINKLHSEREISKITGIKRTSLQNILLSLNLKTKKEDPRFKQKTLRKAKKIFLERYGVDNPAKCPEIKRKIYNTCVERYGENYCFSIFLSKFQERVQDYISSICPTAQFEVGGFRKWNRLRGRHYSPRVDILLPEQKIVIECYGDYWHANPKLFRGDDIIATYKKDYKARDIWKLDKSRKRQIESFGYKVHIIWERDFNTNPTDVKTMIDQWCFSP